MYTSVLLLATLSAHTPAQMYQGSYGCYSAPTARHVTANVKGGKVTVEENQIRYVQVYEEYIEKVKNDAGMVVEVRKTVMRAQAVPYQTTQVYDAEKVRFLDNEGKKVASAQAVERLEKATPVLAVFDGQPVDPTYLSLLRKGTLVLILPNLPPLPPQKLEKPFAPKKEAPRAGFAPIGSVGEQRPKTPNGVPPIHAQAHIDAKGVAHIQETTERKEIVDVKVAEELGGGVKDAIAKVAYTRTLVNKRSLDAKWLKAHGVDGKAIDAKTLEKKLTKPTIVLVSADGKNVDPYFLQIFREDVIVLVVPVPYLAAIPIDPKTLPKGEDGPKKLPAPK